MYIQNYFQISIKFLFIFVIRDTVDRKRRLMEDKITMSLRSTKDTEWVTKGHDSYEKGLI